MEMKQEINWQIGVPTQGGLYLVSHKNGFVDTCYWEEWRDKWECEHYNGNIVAWFPIDYIQPFESVKRFQVITF